MIQREPIAYVAVDEGPEADRIAMTRREIIKGDGKIPALRQQLARVTAYEAGPTGDQYRLLDR